MRFLADECVDSGIVMELRAAGHDVRMVQEVERGLPDRRVLALAAAESRVLLTEDKDFGELAFRHGAQAVPGIMLIRIAAEVRHRKAAQLKSTINRFGHRLFGHYTVVEEHRTRIRPLP